MAQAPAAIAPVERAADRPPAVDCTRLAGLSLPCVRAIGSRKQAGPGALANHHKWPPSRPMEACSVHHSSPAQLENPPGGVHPWRAVAEAHLACCWPRHAASSPAWKESESELTCPCHHLLPSLCQAHDSAVAFPRLGIGSEVTRHDMIPNCHLHPHPRQASAGRSPTWRGDFVI